MVAVDTCERVLMVSGDRDIERATPLGIVRLARILLGTAIASSVATSRLKALHRMARSGHLITGLRISLLKLQG